MEKYEETLLLKNTQKRKYTVKSMLSPNDREIHTSQDNHNSRILAKKSKNLNNGYPITGTLRDDVIQDPKEYLNPANKRNEVFHSIFRTINLDKKKNNLRVFTPLISTDRPEIGTMNLTRAQNKFNPKKIDSNQNYKSNQLIRKISKNYKDQARNEISAEEVEDKFRQSMKNILESEHKLRSFISILPTNRRLLNSKEENSLKLFKKYEAEWNKQGSEIEKKTVRPKTNSVMFSGESYRQKKEQNEFISKQYNSKQNQFGVNNWIMGLRKCPFHPEKRNILLQYGNKFACLFARIYDNPFSEVEIIRKSDKQSKLKNNLIQPSKKIIIKREKMHKKINEIIENYENKAEHISEICIKGDSKFVSEYTNFQKLKPPFQLIKEGNNDLLNYQDEIIKSNYNPHKLF